MRNNRFWIVTLLALLLLSTGGALFLRFRPASGTVANIYKDGICIRSVDISAVTEPYEFTVTDARGSNTVRIEPGRICVREADCPDRICVKAGWRSDSSVPIVCLPHRLVIRLEKGPAFPDTAPDAIAE